MDLEPATAYLIPTAIEEFKSTTNSTTAQARAINCPKSIQNSNTETNVGVTLNSSSVVALDGEDYASRGNRTYQA